MACPERAVLQLIDMDRRRSTSVKRQAPAVGSLTLNISIRGRDRNVSNMWTPQVAPLVSWTGLGRKPCIVEAETYILAPLVDTPEVRIRYPYS